MEHGFRPKSLRVGRVSLISALKNNQHSLVQAGLLATPRRRGSCVRTTPCGLRSNCGGHRVCLAAGPGRLARWHYRGLGSVSHPLSTFWATFSRDTL